MYQQWFFIGLERASKQRSHWQSSHINLDEACHLSFAVWYRIEEKNKTENRLIEKGCNVEDTSSDDFDIDLSKDSNLDGLFGKNDNFWEYETDGFLKEEVQSSWIDINNTLK